MGMRIIVTEGDSGTMVYCKGCGALAGTPTDCVVWNSHDFASTTVPVICKGCGAIPGKATKCKVWNSHDFAPIPEPKY